MEASGSHGALEDVVDLFPKELDDDDARERLRAFARDLDGLVAEGDGLLVVDRDALDKAVNESGIFPRGVRERVWADIQENLGKALSEVKDEKRLLWREFAERDTVEINPIPVEGMRDIGISASASVDEVREIIRKRAPDFPDYVLDSEPEELREIAIKGLEHNRTVWECVRSKLGLFAALAIFAAVGAFLIVGTAFGPWGIPLAIWLISVLGFGTGTVVGNCVKNPNA